MGFLKSLEDSLRTDLSDRVVLLHGLSGRPSPHGSYALCEVDLSADGDLIGAVGSEKDVQFIIKAIPRTYTRVKSSESNVRFGDVTQDNRKSSEGRNGICYSDSESLQGDGVSLAEDVKQREDNSGGGGGAKTILNCCCPDSSNYSTLSQVGYVDIVEGQDTSLLSTELSILAPGLTICLALYETLVSIVRELQGSFVDGSEDHKRLEGVLCPGSPEYEVKGGVSKFEDYEKAFIGNDVACRRRNIHPNLAPILGLLQGQSHLYVIYLAMPFTFQSILYFTPGALGEDLQICFLIFQVLSAVAYSHKQGVIHGDLRSANVLVTETLWCLVTGFL